MYKIKKIVYLDTFHCRLLIKGFSTSQSRDKFIDGANGQGWSECDSKLHLLKPGTYVFAGGKWRNVKSIDPSALAHM